MTTTYELSEAGVRAALADLGSTERQVAATLRELGLKGERSRAGTCPIANYLYDAFPAAQLVAVSGEAVYAALPGSKLELTTPQPCRDFVTGFDVGAYPDLVAAGGEGRG